MTINIAQFSNGLDRYLSKIDSSLSSQALKTSVPFLEQVSNSPPNQLLGRMRSSLKTGLNELGVLSGRPYTYSYEAQSKLFEILGNGPRGLSVLKDLTGDGKVDRDDVQIEDRASGIFSSGGYGYGGYIGFKVKVGETASRFNQTLTSQNLGLPNLGLSIAGNTAFQVDSDLLLDFGFDLDPTDYSYSSSSASSIPGYVARGSFYANTGNAQEFGLSFKLLDFQPSSGKLGALPITVSDAGTGLSANFAIDFRDSSDAGDKLTDSELQGLSNANFATASLSGNSNIKLNLTTNLPTGGLLPVIKTQLQVNWLLNTTKLDPTQPATLGGVPNVSFNNVQLDMATFMGNFLSPILQKVNDVTSPVRSITDKLTAPITPLSKLLKRDVNLFDIAEIIGKVEPDYKLDLSFVKAAANLISLAGNLPNASDVNINFGSLPLTGVDVRSPGFKLTNFSPVGSSLFYTGGSSATVKNFIDSLQNGGAGVGDFRLPILTNPSEVYKLLFGNTNVTLFDYKMPTLSVRATGGQTIPIIGPVGVRLEGRIGADINLKFGFDTAGLTKYTVSNNTVDILEGGFFLDSGTAPLSVNAGVSAGPAIDLGVARATVQGGILGTIDFKWRDDKNPNDLNKVRLSELSANLGTLRIFELSGQLDAAMSFKASVIGLDPYELLLGAVTLYPAGGTPKAFPEKSGSTLPKGAEAFFDLPNKAQDAVGKLGVAAAEKLLGPKTGPKLVNALAKLDRATLTKLDKSGLLDLATGQPLAGVNLLVKYGPAAIKALDKANVGGKIKGYVNQALTGSLPARQKLKEGLKATDQALGNARKEIDQELVNARRQADAKAADAQRIAAQAANEAKRKADQAAAAVAAAAKDKLLKLQRANEAKRKAAQALLASKRKAAEAAARSAREAQAIASQAQSAVKKAWSRFR